MRFLFSVDEVQFGASLTCDGIPEVWYLPCKLGKLGDAWRFLLACRRSGAVFRFVLNRCTSVFSPIRSAAKVCLLSSHILVVQAHITRYSQLMFGTQVVWAPLCLRFLNQFLYRGCSAIDREIHLFGFSSLDKCPVHELG